MRFHNIITQTQTQTSSLSCRFGGEERLEDFVFDFFWDAISIVFYGDFNPLAEVFGGDGDGGFVGFSE
jgi:hypothetical protein